MAFRYGAEWDNPKPVPVTRRYVVASTGRSGSTLLCRLLWDSGLCGKPEEYLHPGHAPALMERWGLSGDGSYVQALPTMRSSPNGVFGTKAHWPQFIAAAQTNPHQVTQLVRDARWVFITRQDVVAQSISMVRAARTGQWTAEVAAEQADRDEVPEEPQYRFLHLLHMTQAIQSRNASWDEFFSSNNITPLRITYESLVDDMAAEYARVFDHITEGLDMPENAHALPPINTERQPNPQAAEWRAQFARDASAWAVNARNEREAPINATA